MMEELNDLNYNAYLARAIEILTKRWMRIFLFIMLSLVVS